MSLLGSQYNPAFGYFDTNSLDNCQSMFTLSTMSHIVVLCIGPPYLLALLSSWSCMCLVSSFPNTVLEVLYIYSDSWIWRYLVCIVTLYNNTSVEDGHTHFPFSQVAVQVYCSHCRRLRLCGIMLELCLYPVYSSSIMWITTTSYICS